MLMVKFVNDKGVIFDWDIEIHDLGQIDSSGNTRIP